MRGQAKGSYGKRKRGRRGTKEAKVRERAREEGAE